MTLFLCVSQGEAIDNVMSIGDCVTIDDRHSAEKKAGYPAFFEREIIEAIERQAR